MSPASLRVRVYGVRFGDAVLVSIPDRAPTGEEETRHILIDVGNVLSGEGGDDAVFEPVIDDVSRVLDGHPLDLYVMTHEHLDHVQGLLHASEKLGIEIAARHAWLTASAAPDYYANHPDAKKALDETQEVFDGIDRFLKAKPEAETHWIRSMMLNNSPRSTKNCVDHLRKVAPKPSYVYRECDIKDAHPFKEVRFKIWAPEEDTSVYYGHFQPMSLGTASGREPGAEAGTGEPAPPPGVDAGDFYNLVGLRRRGYVENLLAIDKAKNNTSVVFSLEWRGWRLLFAGDAEHRSWKTMNKYGVLEPVHFLKVSHHGSHTGMPDAELLDKILPVPPPDDRPRSAVVSTYPDTYKDVPDKELIESELRPRCEVKYVDKGTVSDGDHLDFDFPG
jgi:hypothetical protein